MVGGGLWWDEGLGVGRRGLRRWMRRNGGIEEEERPGADDCVDCGVDRCEAVG